MHGRTVAATHQYQGTDNAHHGRYTDAGQGKTGFTLLEQVPRTDTDNEDGTCHPSAGNGVQELYDSHRIEHQRPEVHHFVTHRVGIERHTHRMLHPRVGYQNPYGRDAGSDTGHPSSEQVCLLAYLVPSEEHDGEEGSFHEEGQDAFDSERSPEDIAHEPGIIAPVGTKLELEDDARSNAHGKVDGEELHPELGGVLPKIVFLNYIQGFHGGHDDSQPQGKGHENPMVTGRKGELCPRPID